MVVVVCKKKGKFNQNLPEIEKEKYPNKPQKITIKLQKIGIIIAIKK